MVCLCGSVLEVRMRPRRDGVRCQDWSSQVQPVAFAMRNSTQRKRRQGSRIAISVLYLHVSIGCVSWDFWK